MLRRPRLRGILGCALALTVALAGCGGNGQSALNPQSHPAHEISNLWWVMMGVAWVVFLLVVGLLGLGWRRRRKEGFPLIGQHEGVANGMVVFLGIVVPVLALAGLFGVANLAVIQDTQAPAAATTQMTIDVIGHQWFWEVRYPGTGAVTANEIHIPARTRVNVVATTADVIHSFWVPELNRKIDMIPGHRNRVMLYADHPGVYRGQCAEFCGAQHANMAMKVFADTPTRFRSWLANMRSRARIPTTAAERRGERVFLTNACANCHTLRGTPAHGSIGPDLTHLQSRTTLAANTIPNTKGYLGGWILDPQHVKPGNKMPGLNLSGPDFQALLTYLETLR